MATNQPASVLKGSVVPGEPISLSEAATLAKTTVELASRALIYLGKQGVFLQVRRRLWVRTGAPADPYRLGARIAAPYAFAYGSALVLAGAGSSERSAMLISSPHRFSEFAFEGVRYRWARPWNSDGLERVPVGPEFVWTTTPERTLVDCVRVPANAAGIDELARSIDSLGALDDKQLVHWVDHYGEAAIAARLGYLLERSGLFTLQEPPLRELLARRPEHRVYLADRRPGGRLVRRWNLIVPPYLAPQGA
jgi:predicted transcriptional regulator of viral defense system